jgi:SnoaL-like domain
MSCWAIGEPADGRPGDAPHAPSYARLAGPDRRASRTRDSAAAGRAPRVDTANDGGRRNWPGLLAPPRLAQAAVAVLSGATAVALIAVGLTLNPAASSAGSPAAAARSAPIRGFYVAVNSLLAGGEARALDPFVAPGVVVHAPDGQISGLPALAARIAALGVASPGLRFEIDDLMVDEDRAVATVESAASAPLASDLDIQGASAPRQTTERFRLAAGRIVEYWPAPADPNATRSLPPLTVPLWLGTKQVAMARFAFPPGAALVDLVAPGPHLLLPETGTLSVSVEGQAELTSAAGVWLPTVAEQPLTLHPGDALLVPGAVHHTIRNGTAAAASMLGVQFYSNVDLTGGKPPPTPALGLYIYGSSPVGLSEHWNGDASTELLARGLDICSARETSSLRVAWLSLDPGQSLAPRRVAGAELLAVNAGALLVGVAHPAIPTDPNALRPGSTPSRGSGVDESAAAQVAMAGDAVVFATGLSAPIVNTGTEPARLLLVAAGPPDDGGPTSPATDGDPALSGPCQPGPATGSVQ